MANLTQVELPNGTTYDIQDAQKSGVYTVIGTQTEATASWTGELHGVAALYDGLTINYYLPYAGVSSTNVTLNLTLDDGTTTGAKNCYINTSRLTTHYGAGRTIVMTYYSAGSISISGTATEDDRWICDAYYDTNSDTKVRQTLLSTNTNRPLLMSYGQTSSTTTNVDNVVYRSNDMYANPSTGTITATKFSGDLVGNADTATNASAVNGHTVGIDVPSNALFTDQNVTQTYDIQAEGTFALLMEYTADGGTLTEGVRKSGATYDNATGELYTLRVRASEATIPSFTGNVVTCNTINGVTVGNSPEFTDTKNTAGSTDTSSKIFLVGATSQAANPQTYSQDTVYVDTDGHVYSNSKQVVNLSDTQALTNKTYNGYTLAAACAKAVVTSVDTSASLPTSNAVKTFVEGKGYVTTDTKNTAGSTDTSSKIYLIGATEQSANPQTYSDDEVYATDGVLTTKSVQIGGGSASMVYNASTQSIDFIFN